MFIKLASYWPDKEKYHFQRVCEQCSNQYIFNGVAREVMALRGERKIFVKLTSYWSHKETYPSNVYVNSVLTNTYLMVERGKFTPSNDSQGEIYL